MMDINFLILFNTFNKIKIRYPEGVEVVVIYWTSAFQLFHMLRSHYYSNSILLKEKFLFSKKKKKKKKNQYY